MQTYTDKSIKDKQQNISASLHSLSYGNKPAFYLQDNRSASVVQRKQGHLIDNRPQSIVQRKRKEFAANQMVSETNIQRKANTTGLPDQLKSGIENLSGHSMDDVKVHYNSSQPAQLNAHAYAQGTDIHLAPGQEKHLPHEAWHVVQQKQGRVKPTMQMKGKVSINEDKGLEEEADVMGGKAIYANFIIQSQAIKGNYVQESPKLNETAPFQLTKFGKAKRFQQTFLSNTNLTGIVLGGNNRQRPLYHQQHEEHEDDFAPEEYESLPPPPAPTSLPQDSDVPASSLAPLLSASSSFSVPQTSVANPTIKKFNPPSLNNAQAPSVSSSASSSSSSSSGAKEDDDYLYHSTNKWRLRSIKQIGFHSDFLGKGLTIKAAVQGGRKFQGSDNKKWFFSEKKKYASDDLVTIRLKKMDLIKKGAEKEGNDWVYEGDIKPEEFEVLFEGKEIPLKDFTEDDFDKLENEEN